MFKTIAVSCGLMIGLLASVARADQPLDPDDVENAVVFAPDGELVFSGGSDSRVRIRDGHTGRVLTTLLGHEASVTTMAVAPDGTVVASGSVDGTIRLWDIGRRVERAKFVVPKIDVDPILADYTERVFQWSGVSMAPNTLGSIAFAPDGATIAAGYNSGEIRLWDLASKTVKRTWHTHKSPINRLVYAPDGQQLATSCGGVFQTWDVASGRLQHPVVKLSHLGVSLAYSPDGKRLALASTHEISIRETGTGNEVTLIPIPPTFRYPRVIVYDPDGRYLYTGGSGGIQFCSLDQLEAGLKSLADPLFGRGFDLSISHDRKWLAYCTRPRIRSNETRVGMNVLPIR